MNKLSNFIKPKFKNIRNSKKSAVPESVIQPQLHDVENLLQPLTTAISAGKRTYLFFLLARIRRELRHRYRDFASAFLYSISKACYRVEVRGLDNYSYSPSTILACSHKRDADIGVIIPSLFTFHGSTYRKKMRLLYEATRDDFYERGFLVNYFPSLDWARPLLARTSVRGMMHALQTCPVKLPDEQTVNQLLQETRRLEGNLTLGEAITEEWRTKLLGSAANNPELRLMDAVLKAPYDILTQYASPRMFKEPLCSRIRERHHQTMMQQLHMLTRVLDKGGTLFILPEGKLTPDGRFCKMRAALTRLVQSTRADVKMTPINVTYDFMDTGRPKAIMIVGEELNGIKRYAKNELAEIVGRVIPGLACVTMSGLASRYLIELAERGADKVRYFQFRDYIWNEYLKLKALGFQVDQELDTRQSFVERLERYLKYCKSVGNIFLASYDLTTTQLQLASSPLHTGDEWLFLNLPALIRQECQRADDHPVRYCYNELKSLLVAHGLEGNLPVENDNLIPLRRGSKKQYTAG